MKSIKLTSVLLSGILAALATVPAYSAADRETVPIVDPTTAPVVPTEDPAIVEALGNYVEFCPPSWQLIGTRLCLSPWRAVPPFILLPLRNYTEAQYDCMTTYGSRVANIEDYHYTWHQTSPNNSHLALGIWLGPRTGDNLALFCSGPMCSNPLLHPADIDNEGSVFNLRQYRCALGPNWY